MMSDGGFIDEKIVLNDITLWSGSEQDPNNYDAYKSVGRIQALLLQGRSDEAEQLVNANFVRSEEHTSELQSLMRISYAVFCLKKKTIHIKRHTNRNKFR